MGAVLPLAGVIRPYAWGSRTSIAELQGRPAPSATPEAELWLGAHPGDPSTVAGADGPVSLATLIADDPEGQLGAEVAGEFGVRLPYLMKVLAAAAPLSLQAHPDADYARRAFAAQEADPQAPKNYTDAYHKPEMLVALTPFEALCGFREPAESAAALEALGIERLAPVVESLRTGPSGLGEAVRTLLTWPAADRAALIDEVVAAGTSPLASGLASHYPGDPGVLVALLLHHVRLEPGEAIWMPAGNLHAYLDGTGVEIMAASDNVLRGGLTPKRVDVDELLRVLRFEVLQDPILPATELAPGVVTWKVPVREFALYRIDLDPTSPPVRLPAEGPRIVLGTRGDVHVAEAVDGTPVEITAGTAAFIPASTGPATLAGVGQAFVAAVAS
ncbi:mannose-6-phosphate isomerase, class I [Couchioplanes azureus]|uniref:mannose-6-phosphate isomerase, class I n=1 Tax=Couchioplanes caeruleus TaxID=56438 RepID=UPI0016705311|nr:mannose-6-phosphate isomerase, class I [Couchioplanes caeruleus]GGQ64916.1 putative mannose-6-phosphate isomerase ManA [Couchioplanes caeruleus subsp. azureus]